MRHLQYWWLGVKDMFFGILELIWDLLPFILFFAAIYTIVVAPEHPEWAPFFHVFWRLFAVLIGALVLIGVPYVIGNDRARKEGW